jgi:PAS domain S-box-containing protein
MPLQRGCGEPRYFTLRLRVMRSANGGVEGVLAVGEDVSEQVRIEKALRVSEARFRAMSGYNHDILLVVDSSGAITFGNEAMERLLGRLGGSAFERVHPEDRPGAIAALERMARDPAAPVMNDFEVRLQRENGEWRWLSFTAANLLADEALRGIVLSGRDITRRKRAEAALADSQERLHTVLKSSAVGIWELDLRTGIVTLDDNCARIAVIKASDAVITVQAWESCVDRAQREAAQHWLREATAVPGVWDELEYLHHDRQGGARWLLLRGRTETDPTGVPQFLAGVMLDVDASKQTELLLAEREARLETAL